MSRFGPCMCGDTECPSCGRAQGTLRREQARETAYENGQDACEQGVLETDCPLTDPTLRVDWIDGWRDFNTEHRIPWENDMRDRAENAT